MIHRSVSPSLDSAWGFVKLQREPIGVLEEGEALSGSLVDPDGFNLDSMGVEAGDGFINIADFECQVTQALGFRVAQAVG